jgi:amidase
MVSAWFLAKAILAVAPLTSVYAQYSAPSSLPLLLDATTEELALGLEAGNFTSVDLVNVSLALSINTLQQLTEPRHTSGVYSKSTRRFIWLPS